MLPVGRCCLRLSALGLRLDVNSELRLASLSLGVRSEVVWSFVVVWDPFGLMLSLLGWNVQSELGRSV